MRCGRRTSGAPHSHRGRPMYQARVRKVTDMNFDVPEGATVQIFIGTTPMAPLLSPPELDRPLAQPPETRRRRPLLKGVGIAGLAFVAFVVGQNTAPRRDVLMMASNASGASGQRRADAGGPALRAGLLPCVRPPRSHPNPRLPDARRRRIRFRRPSRASCSSPSPSHRLQEAQPRRPRHRGQSRSAWKTEPWPSRARSSGRRRSSSAPVRKACAIFGRSRRGSPRLCAGLPASSC